MTIRPFQLMDYRRLRNKNQFGEQDYLPELLENKRVIKSTILQGDNVLGIIAFFCYNENNYVCSISLSNEIKLRHIREIKEYLLQALCDFKAERLQTDSIKCDILTKWHTFLGFKSEGVRFKMLDGKDYEMWAMLKGRDF